MALNGQLILLELNVQPRESHTSAGSPECACVTRSCDVRATAGGGRRAKAMHRSKLDSLAHLQMGFWSSRSSGGISKLPSFTADEVDPRGDLGPPSGSPIRTSV